MNGLEEILEDVLKQYQRVGYQTQVLRLKNTGEVIVSLRMGRVIANMKISIYGCCKCNVRTMGIGEQRMKDEDYAKMIHGMMEAREKERMLGIRVLIIAHNAYKFQGCAQIYRNYLPQHIAIHVRKQYLAELNRKRKGGRNAQGDSH